MALSSARASVFRSALIFTPVWALTLVGLVVLARDAFAGDVTAGLIVGLTLVSLVALLFTYQVVQSVRDLFTQPVETSGLVERRWSRNEFLLFRNDYVFVGRNVFRIHPEQFIEVDLGDTVRIVHYPHTATVESVEVLARAAPQQAARG